MMPRMAWGWQGERRGIVMSRKDILTQGTIIAGHLCVGERIFQGSYSASDRYQVTYLCCQRQGDLTRRAIDGAVLGPRTCIACRTSEAKRKEILPGQVIGNLLILEARDDRGAVFLVEYRCCKERRDVSRNTVFRQASDERVGIVRLCNECSAEARTVSPKGATPHAITRVRALRRLNDFLGLMPVASDTPRDLWGHPCWRADGL